MTAMNIQTLLHSIRPLLDSRLEGEVLLASVLGVSRTYLHTWPGHIIKPEQKKCFDALVHRRLCGEPLAYLVGNKEFWSLSLMVTPAVLIPRPETELLVEQALHYGAAKGEVDYRVLDLGTGSGAIALALAVERPSWKIVAVDRSNAALEVALQNAKNLGVTTVQFYQSDWFSYFSNMNICHKQFDMIIANPPYIAPQDIQCLTKELQYEPKEALFSEPDGIQAIWHIIQEAPHYLKNKAWLMLEHGCNQDSIAATYMQLAGFSKIKNIRDLAGLNRIIMAYHETDKD